MSLSSLQLDAFLEVARRGSFSEAARRLHLTQPALSQRIGNLEEALGAALLIRGPGGTRPTETGEALLRYCGLREQLEGELVGRLRSPADALSGAVRIGGYSTVLRSLVMPALGDLIARHPAVQLELLNRELRELPGLLTRGEADFVLLDREWVKAGVRSTLLGHEENILIEPARATPAGAATYLDHDREDATTESFLRQQRGASGPPARRRSYLDEIYGIIDGVALGWGRAVVPRHLIRGRRGVKVVRGCRPQKVPIYLCALEQPYSPALQDRITQALIEGVPRLLGG